MPAALLPFRRCGSETAVGRAAPRGRSSSKASATAAQHARSLSRECRRRVTGARRRRRVADRVCDGDSGRDLSGRRSRWFGYGAEHVPRTGRDEQSWTRSDAASQRDACPGRAFSDVPDVRSRSLPRTDSETMSRGPSSLAVRATSGRLDRRSTSPRSPTVSAGRTEGGGRAVWASADGSGRRRSSCTNLQLRPDVTGGVHGCQSSVMTTLPLAWPCSTYASASRVWSNGNVLSMTGRRWPAS